MGQPSVATINEWLKDVLKEGSTVGFDGKVISKYFKNMLEKTLCKKNMKYDLQWDLVDMIWEDRPEIPMDSFYSLDVKYAGKSRVQKINEVREEMKKDEATHFILSSLDDIAWLFNIRGNDVPCNPVIISYAIVSENEAILFVDSKKVTDEIRKELEIGRASCRERV